MKLVLLLVLMGSALAGHIRSGPIKVEYGFNGLANAFSLPISLESGLSPTDYFLIIWPELLHIGTAKTAIQASLLTEDGNILASTLVIANSVLTDSRYYVGFALTINPSTWYSIRIQPTLTPTLVTGFVQIQTVSDYTSANKIVYDSNMGYGYYFIQTSVAGPPATLTLAVSSPSSTTTIASNFYYLYVDVTPSISSSNGGNFTVALYYDSAVHTTGSAGLMDFQIVGDCQAIAACPACTAAVLTNCNIDTSLESFTFSISSTVAGQKIRIQTQIQNPIYSTIRGIRAYWVDAINGIIQENAKAPMALTVAAIPLVDLGQDRVYLLWGLPAGYSDANTAGITVGIYAADSTSPLNGPMNSFNIGFKVTATSPIDALFNVHILLSAQGVLQGSLVHNFPTTTNATYCTYVSPELICYNVGSFSDPDLRYFISGKAYYDSTTPANIANFGGITIESIAYDDFGIRIPGVLLFTPLVAAIPMPVKTSSNFLDMAGIHSPSLAVRYTQVISEKDDLSRSALAKAMIAFTQGNASTIGIVPDLNVSQQLIFLLNVPQNKMSMLSGDNRYEMKLLYNSRVVGFETGAYGQGLDFAGWSTASNNWTIESASCFQPNKVVSQKYFDNFTGYQTMNTQTILQDNMNNSLYGVFNFQCGQSSTILAAQASVLCGGDCVDECQIFKGFTNTDLGNGVISMRRVTFPPGYNSPLYADSNVLDFLITFLNAGTATGSILINGYTVKAVKMVNIKAAYVNYYDDAANTNKGVRIPTMIRIGGAALANESLGADTVAVFFDQNTLSTSFQDAGTYSIGCSTGDCLYFSNAGVVTPQDVWVNSPRVQFRSVPTLLTEFNLLVPVTQTLLKPPSSMTIAFMSTNYTVGGIGGLMRVLSVFRLFGAAVASSITVPIPTINSLATVAPSGLNADFNSTLWLGAGVTAFQYAIDPALITSTPQNNTVAATGTPVNLIVNGQYGSGITITSFYYNIFGTAYLKANGANSGCTYFWYNYWELAGAINVERTGKPVHVMYCPIDSNLSLATSQGDVILLNPQYPSSFSNGFPLQTILAYGLSSPQGLLMAYKLQTGTISSTTTCTTLKQTPYYPNSPGKQRSMFSVSFTPQIFSPSPKLYSSFIVALQFPATTVTSAAALTVTTPLCDSLDSRFSCTISSLSTLSFNIQFTLLVNTPVTISTMSFNVYATSSALFGPIDNYTLTIYLPQSNAGVLQAFGPDYTSKSTYATCSNSFTISLTGTSSVITLNSLVLEHPSQSVKGFVSYTLGFDYREAFFSTSQLQLQLGFLQSPSVWRTRGDFFCGLYEYSTGQPSWLWSSIDYAAFPMLKIYPKAEFLTPNTHVMKVACHGGAIPDAAMAAQPIGATWVDSGSSIETSISNITYPTGMLAAATFVPVILTKRFNTPGMLGYYTFSIPISAALTTQSRFLIEFPSALPSWVNDNQQVECYMRLVDNPATNDISSTEAFCKAYEEKRVIVYTSINVTAGSTLYIDVFNIRQPLASDVGVSSFISIALDLDSTLSNGVYQYGEVLEAPPSSAPIGTLSVVGTVVTPLLLQTAQTITILFTAPLSTFSAARRLYVLLPAGYTPWNSRGSTLAINSSCSVIDTLAASPVELVSGCMFISRRIIGIDVVASATSTNFKLLLQGLISPIDVSTEYQKSVQFNLFLVSDTTEVTVSLFTFSRLFSSVSMLFNTNQLYLGWYDGQGTPLTTDSNILMVYQGYYRNYFSLRAQDYPSPFQEMFNFSISNYNSLAFNVQPVCSTQLGYNQTMYRMAADPTLSLPLMYTLQFSKANDTKNLYSLVPPLKIVVSSQQCALTALESIYTLAVGGATLPIVINASQCIPMGSINISVVFGSFASELSAANDLSNVMLNSTSVDGVYYLVVMHTPGSLAAGNNITASFVISGPQSSYYQVIPPVTLTAVSIDPTLAVPVSVLPQIISSPQSPTFVFQLQCSMPSTIYWAVGLAPTVLTMTGLDIQARIISDAKGYYTNFTEPNDPFYRIYGVTYSSRANALVNQTVSGLRSNSAYQFRYFCMDQLGRVSEGQTINFTSINSGGYLLRLQLFFNSSMQYGQISDLACSLAENLLVPYLRVMTAAMSTCYDRRMVFYPNATTTLIEPTLSNGIYSYGIYILPDYSLQYDNTNANVKAKLSDPLFLSRTLTSTVNSSQLPWLISLSTQDVPYVPNFIPTMSIVSIQPTETGAIVTALITNMNGYIVIAMMHGLFYPNLTKPSQVNIKQGLFNEFLTLDAVQMQYSAMNILVSFTVSTLRTNADYTLYYYATVDDPQYSSLASSVGAINITTSAHYIITVDWASRELVLLLLLAVSAFLIL